MRSKEPPHPDRGDPGPIFSGPNLVGALTRWAAEIRVEHAARTRSRERSIRDSIARDTSFGSVLADLAERDTAVLIHTRTGRRHRGSLAVLGTDFVVLRTNTGSDVLVALAGIDALRAQPREPGAWSGRPVSLEAKFVEVISAIVSERPRVRVVTANADVLSGHAVEVGTDVLCLRVDGAGGSDLYVPLESVVEFGEVAASG